MEGKATAVRLRALAPEQPLRVGRPGDSVGGGACRNPGRNPPARPPQRRYHEEFRLSRADLAAKKRDRLAIGRPCRTISVLVLRGETERRSFANQAEVQRRQSSFWDVAIPGEHELVAVRREAGIGLV